MIRYRDGQTIRRGDRVRCDREKPAAGSWHRYAGRAGTVRTINDQSASRTVYAEIGVELDGAHGHLITWFLPSELVLEAPRRPQEAR